MKLSPEAQTRRLAVLRGEAPREVPQVTPQPTSAKDNPVLNEGLSPITYRRLYLNVLHVTLSESTGEYAGAHEPDCYTLQCPTLEELERRAKALAADGYTLDIEVRACRDETQGGEV